MSVYFAVAGPYTKVGYSKKPWSRISTVTTNGTRPADLPRAADVELIGWIPGNTKTELEYHERFANSRVAGEWFVVDLPVLEEIIWADPRGVHMKGMSAQAVFACMEYPELTRDQLADCGVRIKAATREESRAFFDDMFAGLLPERGASA